MAALAISSFWDAVFRWTEAPSEVTQSRLVLGVFLAATACQNGSESNPKPGAKTNVERELGKTGEKHKGGQPESCRRDCVTEFGSELGASHGIKAWSNCQPSCIDPSPNFVSPATTGLNEPTYTGIVWQCVEYARRYWLLQKGIVFGSVDTADDMWAQTKNADHLSTKRKLDVIRFENGGSESPQVDDLIIYRAIAESADLKFGHVAVVVAVDHETGLVAVAEQNYSNKPWSSPQKFARQLTLQIEVGTFTVSDLGQGIGDPDRIYGWLRAAAVQ